MESNEEKPDRGRTTQAQKQTITIEEPIRCYNQSPLASPRTSRHTGNTGTEMHESAATNETGSSGEEG